MERFAGGWRIRGWRRPLRGSDTVPWGAGTRLLRVLPARSESLFERCPESPAPELCRELLFGGAAPSHPVRGCGHLGMPRALEPRGGGPAWLPILTELTWGTPGAELCYLCRPDAPGPSLQVPGQNWNPRWFRGRGQIRLRSASSPPPLQLGPSLEPTRCQGRVPGVEGPRL